MIFVKSEPRCQTSTSFFVALKRASWVVVRAELYSKKRRQHQWPPVYGRGKSLRPAECSQLQSPPISWGLLPSAPWYSGRTSPEPSASYAYRCCSPKGPRSGHFGGLKSLKRWKHEPCFCWLWPLAKKIGMNLGPALESQVLPHKNHINMVLFDMFWSLDIFLINFLGFSAILAITAGVRWECSLPDLFGIFQDFPSLIYFLTLMMKALETYDVMMSFVENYQIAEKNL